MVKTHSWLKDYIVDSQNSKHFQNNSSHFVSYQHSPSHFKDFTASISSHHEPTSFIEAIIDHNWAQALQTELQALIHNKTWDIVPLPQHKKPSVVVDCAK
jgi:hypothetical protein